MTEKTRSFVTALAGGVLGLGALMLGGCAGDLNPVRDVFVGVGVGATPAPAPDFVEASRESAPTDYVPIAVMRERETPAKSAAEIAELEAELDADRDAALKRGESARDLAIGPAPEPVTVPPPIPIEDDPPPPVRP